MWCVLAFTLPALGAPDAQGPSFTLIEENDALADSDRHYTQGFKLAYFHPEGVLPFALSNVLYRVPAWGFRDFLPRFGYDIGQNIYTPADLQATAVVPDDRPYAGWLYTGIIIQRRGTGWWDKPMLESFEAEFGMIGPASLAEEVQNFGHKVIGFDQPQGWQNQLRNEPAVLLKFSRSLRLSLLREGWLSSDCIPHAGFTLGNVNTSARLGATCRLGLHLPDDFGVQTIDSLQTSASGRVPGHPPDLSVYVFGRVEGRAVAWNEFLDGNVLRSSHHVEKDPLVYDLFAGGAVVLHYLEIGYTHTFRSREFTGQKTDDSFSSFYVRIRF